MRTNLGNCLSSEQLMAFFASSPSLLLVVTDFLIPQVLRTWHAAAFFKASKAQIMQREWASRSSSKPARTSSFSLFDAPLMLRHVQLPLFAVAVSDAFEEASILPEVVAATSALTLASKEGKMPLMEFLPTYSSCLLRARSHSPARSTSRPSSRLPSSMGRVITFPLVPKTVSSACVPVW